MKAKTFTVHWVLFFVSLHSVGAALNAEKVSQALESRERVSAMLDEAGFGEWEWLDLLYSGLTNKLNPEEIKAVSLLACELPGDVPLHLRIALYQLAHMSLHQQVDDLSFVLKSLSDCTPESGAGAMISLMAFAPSEEIASLLVSEATALAVHRNTSVAQVDYAFLCNAVCNAMPVHLNDEQLRDLHARLNHIRLSKEFIFSLVGALAEMHIVGSSEFAREWIKELFLREALPVDLRFMLSALEPYPEIKAELISLKRDQLRAASSELKNEAYFPSMKGALADKLRSIIIPAVEFRNASPQDCVSHVGESLKAMSDTPINIIIRNVKEPDLFDMSFSDMNTIAERTKSVTLALRNCSALVILEEICKQTDLQLKEENGIVVIEPNP